MKFLLGSLFFLWSFRSVGQDCTSDEFIFNYYGINQCGLGGTPSACSVIPKGALSGVLGGLGYIGGGKIGKAIGTKLGQREARIRAEISEQVYNEHLGRMNNLHYEWSKVFSAAKSGKPYKNELWSLANETRIDFFDGWSADDFQKQLDKEFLENKGKIHQHLDKKINLSESEISKLQADMEDLFSRARSHLLEKHINSKFRWMRAGLKNSKALGGKIGKVGLATAGALAIPGGELIKKEHLFDKCVGHDGWFSSRGDNPELKDFIEIENDCSINVKESKLNDLIDMFPDQRTEFFKKCQSCCDLLKRRNRELTSKIEKDVPTVAIKEGNCNSDQFTADVTINGNRYTHKYRKVKTARGDEYSLHAGIIPNNDDVSGGNKLSLTVTSDGHFSNPVLNGPVGGSISSKFQNENLAQKLVAWYDQQSGKTIPPKSFGDLSDMQRVQYSVAEQIKAANLSFSSIKSFCKNAASKGHSSPDKLAPGTK